MSTANKIPEIPYAIGPMAALYDLVLRLVELRYDTPAREGFAAWLRSQKPTAATSP